MLTNKQAPKLAYHILKATTICALGLTSKSLIAQTEELEQNALALEEIVVTATKREQLISDIPLSVSVITEDELREAGVKGVADLQNISPNLIITTTSSPANTGFTMRGIGTSGTAGNLSFEQSVGVYIDGVLRGRPGSAMQDLSDIERVEVLRGPQSTIFGRNNTAGAVNITTAGPQFDKSGRIEATVGDENLFELRGTVTGPLKEGAAAYRLTASHSERDGFFDNLTGEDPNARDRQALRGQLLLTPSVDTSVRIIADYSESSDICCARVPIFISPRDLAPAPIPIPGVVIPGALQGANIPGLAEGTPGTVNGVQGLYLDPFERTLATDESSDYQSEDWGISAKLDHDFGGINATVIAAVREYEDIQFNDGDQTDGAINVVLDNDSNIEETSVEIRFADESGGAFDWIVGGYYFDQSILSNSDVRADSVFPIGFMPGNPPRIILSSGTNSLLNRVANYDVESVAIFGQGTAFVTDKFSITGGLRYLDESAEAKINVLAGTNPITPPPGVVLPVPLVSLEPLPSQSGPIDPVENDEVMGDFSVSYDLGDMGNLYARYARGYKSGGINLSPIQIGFDQLAFAPEQVDAIEFGAKLKLLGNHLWLNPTVFYQELTDQQVQSFNGAVLTTTNAAEVISQGVEIDYVFAVTQNLKVSGGITYLDAEYNSFTNAPNLVFLDGSQDLSGEAPAFSPDWTITSALQHSLVLNSAWMFNTRLDMRYQTEYTTTLANDLLFGNDDTFTVDLSASLSNEAGGYGIQFWVKNATDEEIITFGSSVFGAQGSAAVQVNDPRTFGMTAFNKF